MNKIWRIIKYEYSRHVLKKRFLVSLLGVPAAVIAMMTIGILIALFSMDASPVGYVDHSDVLDNPLPIEDEGDLFNPVIDFIPFQSEAAAQADLEDGTIQAFFIIPQNYPDSLEVDLMFFDQPGEEIPYQFGQFIRRNIASWQALDPQISNRLDEGSSFTLKALDGSRETRDDQWYMIFTPLISGVLFIIVVLNSGGYLLQAVVEEKENRTMEIVITSVSPWQLMTGKIIGNIAVGMTQLIIWLLFGWISLKLGGLFWPFLQDFSLPPNYIAVLLLLLLPSFVMVAAIMAAIGATMTDQREAQQVSGLFTLPITIPFYLTASIMANPNGTLAMILSYFPLTAPITILMRMGLTPIPAWQIAINIITLVVFAIFAIWFAGRAFRMGMLQYGKKLSIKEVFRKQVNG